ncbi:MAG TPA: hypothetical protein VHO48_03745 [Anaerolineaceae bacterium]|nr:hypothetical protein [Anaerolineaceae bacterium]
METVPLTFAHWFYAFFVLMIFASLAIKLDTAIVAVVGMFGLGWIILGSPVGGFQAIFFAMVRAGTVLLDIVFIISIVVSLAKGLEPMGAMYLMVRPAKKLMRTPTLTWWVAGVAMWFFSLFLWPSPAAALMGAIFLPAALSVGLPAISLAMSMNLFGHGVALATDYVIQGAPTMTAVATNLPVNDILVASTPLNIVASIVTITVAWFFVVRKDIKKQPKADTEYIKTQEKDLEAAETRVYSKAAKTAAIVVPLAFIADVVLLIALKIRGGEATAVLGGTCIALLSIFLIWEYGKPGIEKITASVQEGFMFGMRCFAPVFLVAGFYLMGVPEHAQAIFGDAGKPLVIDIIKNLANIIPMNKFAIAPLHMILAGVTGLDGSGFNDLPLMGALAASWGQAVGLKTATLAALGQITMIWIGAGCVVPWSLIAVSAVTGVPAVDLGRKNFFPVICGLIAATILAIFLM